MRKGDFGFATKIPLQTLGKPLILETKVPAVWMTSKLLHHPIENLPKFTRFTLPSSCQV